MRPAIDPMFMMRPSWRFTIEGMTAFETRTAANVLSSNAFLTCSIVTSPRGPTYKSQKYCESRVRRWGGGTGLAHCESTSIVNHNVNLFLVRQDVLDNSLYIIVLCHVHNHRTNVFTFKTFYTLEASRGSIDSTSSLCKLLAPEKKHPLMRISTYYEQKPRQR